ncbi:hypothetical protein MNBD_ALPHA11-1491 [hydrothermal vent metagenome]|uniref:Uncharacterized protein n=1 Tax=hydrothermal vent metagenome TaxID=652676 RepID=A0A3B0UV18_9ZZZZ
MRVFQAKPQPRAEQDQRLKRRLRSFDHRQTTTPWNFQAYLLSNPVSAQLFPQNKSISGPDLDIIQLKF